MRTPFVYSSTRHLCRKVIDGRSVIAPVHGRSHSIAWGSSASQSNILRYWRAFLWPNEWVFKTFRGTPDIL